MTILKVLLLPLSILYGVGVGIRNCLYNSGILKSKEFDIPVICVGNITVGGTGKTPHTEMIIAELKKHFRVACLSRGYKRKTSGFILADNHTTAQDIGDEPMQIKNKFPDIIVACDANRVRGIQNLLKLPNRPDVIILDDGFQHRAVKTGRNIVLIDHNQPISKDYLLPMGRLRETQGALKRADHIILTKCPENMTPIERRIITKSLKIKPYQELFFTRMQYGQIKHLSGIARTEPIHKDGAILCLTGIARPEPYITHLHQYSRHITELQYPDHHNFTPKDIKHIQDVFDAIGQKHKYIFTTEKDAVRLSSYDLPQKLQKAIFYMPIEPVFFNRKEVLLNELYDYIRKNKK